MYDFHSFLVTLNIRSNIKFYTTSMADGSTFTLDLQAMSHNLDIDIP